MKVAVFDTHGFEKQTLCDAANGRHDLTFLETRLTTATATLAVGHEVVCAFVNDKLSAEVISILATGGTKLIALRSAGFNHVDLRSCKELGIKVVRVPEYSPYSVAEHAVALILTLNRKIHKAYNRVRESNFSLEGLMGFDLHGKTVGVIGTGKIGKALVRIMRGFGCRVIMFDLKPDESFAKETGSEYLPYPEVIKSSDIISLHLPLSPETRHLVSGACFESMKKGAIFINTSRGGLVDTKALIGSLKKGHIGAAGLDVYEEEENFFFQDHSSEVLKDDVLARLLTFPNVVLTSHQAFLTREALTNIADTTMLNIDQYSKHERLTNEVTAP